MNSEEVYNTWAPPDGLWSKWAKPVLFACISKTTTPPSYEALILMDVAWAEPANGATAIILDLPGASGVWAGLSLADLGYAPVPLYNAIPQPYAHTILGANDSSVVDMVSVLMSLIHAATLLKQSHISANAPPAFILDANRRAPGRIIREDQFDNRSVSLPTDFPSAQFMLSHGIQKVILVQATGTTPQSDLAHTLRRWQEAGIPIWAKALSDSAAPQPIQVSRPPKFRLLFYNFLATLGLYRSPFGGFGGMLPSQSAGG